MGWDLGRIGRGSLDPEEYQPLDPIMDWCEELAHASGLDISPDINILPPSDVATEEGTSCAMVLRRAAETLYLTLPSVAVKTNVLTEMLQLGVTPLRTTSPIQ